MATVVLFPPSRRTSSTTTSDEEQLAKMILKPQWALQKEVDDLKTTVKELEFRLQNISYSTNSLLQSDFTNRGFQEICKERVNDLNNRLRKVEIFQKLQFKAKRASSSPITLSTTTSEKKEEEDPSVDKLKEEYKKEDEKKRREMMFEIGQDGDYHYITIYFSDHEDLKKLTEKLELQVR